MLTLVCFAVAAMMISVGMAAYPVGWYTSEVKDACGEEADIYNLGSTKIAARS